MVGVDRVLREGQRKGWVGLSRRPEEGVGESYEKARGRGGCVLREGHRKGWVRLTRRPEEGVGTSFEKARGRG